MGLPDRSERAERLDELRGWVESFQRRQGDDEVAWVAVSPLIVRLRAWAWAIRARRLSRRRAKRLWRSMSNAPIRGWALAEGHLFLALTENQRRAQAPISERFHPQPLPDSVEVNPARADQLARRALALADSLVSTARTASLELPSKPRLLYRHLLASARALAWCEAMLEATRPRTAVIGTTHAIPARALALAARRAGVPCIYVPHAPVIADAVLADLPVDRAALRGPEEVSYYTSLGASPEGMEAVGNPAVDVDAGPDAEPKEPVFAVPTEEGGALASLTELVAEGLGDGVILAPHPRSDLEALRATVPATWRVWEGRTFDLLRAGPPALVQFSSGVGLEGLQLGIPTIDLAFPSEEPNYPYLRAPYVPRVSTAAELRAAVTAARGASEAERERLRAWARGWVCAEGPAAAEAGAELLERTAAEGPRRQPVWDAWRAGRTSTLRRLISRAAARPYRA